MKYTINPLDPASHLLSISLTLDQIDSKTIRLTLPIWRPGRYEAANYAKNILKFSAHSVSGKTLSWRIPTINTWEVDSEGVDTLVITYQYYAYTMDAGNSWLDNSLVYINFVNCLLYDPARVNNPCSLTIDIPSAYKVGCALSFENGTCQTKDFFELADSPLLASKKLEQLNYSIDSVDFSIWIYGDHQLNQQAMVKAFERFSRAQIETFGEFPEDAYHFLLIILPYKHYHGVEHGKSTVITLGPSEEVHEWKIYKELLGVSSHELFHAWNIIKIRPVEMVPYDFAKPVSFDTGFVAEGFTTYYGDLYLSRSQVFNTSKYFDELNTLFNRHFWNYGRLNESVTQSSRNLWIDGYIPGAPNKKSSIYVEGAMVALCLDLMIRKATDSQKSLDDVMRTLWEKHGKTGIGYTAQQIQAYVEEHAGESLNAFFNDHVFGVNDKESLINELLQTVGCRLVKSPAANRLTKDLGIRFTADNDGWKIVQLAPGSIGEKHFELGQIITSINKKATVDLKDESYEFLNSLQKVQLVSKTITGTHDVILSFAENNYFLNYKIEFDPKATVNQRRAFKLWSGQEMDN